MCIRGTARWRFKFLKEESEYVEIPREKYERLDAAVKEMSTCYYSASDFCPTQVDEVLENTTNGWEKKKNTKKDNRKVNVKASDA
jgi:hypothetical protein